MIDEIRRNAAAMRTANPWLSEEAAFSRALDYRLAALADKAPHVYEYYLAALSEDDQRATRQRINRMRNAFMIELLRPPQFNHELWTVLRYDPQIVLRNARRCWLDCR